MAPVAFLPASHPGACRLASLQRRAPLTEPRRNLVVPDSSSAFIISSTSQLDPQTAAALLLPLLAYKVAAVVNGQKLQWYLDASIALAVTTFLVFVSQN